MHEDPALQLPQALNQLHVIHIVFQHEHVSLHYDLGSSYMIVLNSAHLFHLSVERKWRLAQIWCYQQNNSITFRLALIYRSKNRSLYYHD